MFWIYYTSYDFHDGHIEASDGYLTRQADKQMCYVHVRMQVSFVPMYARQHLERH